MVNVIRCATMCHPFSKWDKVELKFANWSSHSTFIYTAKLLLHQSPTRYSHYTMTGQWPCSACWRLPAEPWLHCHWQLSHSSAGSYQRSLHSHCPVTVWSLRFSSVSVCTRRISIVVYNTFVPRTKEIPCVYTLTLPLENLKLQSVVTVPSRWLME